MSLEENKAIVRRLYEEVGNSKQLDVIDEIVDPDTIDHDPFPGMPNTGTEAYKAVFGASQVAFPDFRMTIDGLIAEGDRVAVQGKVSGTHEGEFMGMPATGKAFSVDNIEVFEIKAGKITQRWGIADTASLMAQLGVAPPM